MLQPGDQLVGVAEGGGKAAEEEGGSLGTSNAARGRVLIWAEGEWHALISQPAVGKWLSPRLPRGPELGEEEIRSSLAGLGCFVLLDLAGIGSLKYDDGVWTWTLEASDKVIP